jgi:uncharacterized protein (DUF1684 family)
MKRNNVIVLVVVIVALISVVYSFVGTDDSSYSGKILKKREEIDRFMRTAPDSPFAASPGYYNGLSYFDPDIRYKVNAKLIPVENKKMVELSTNDQKVKRYMEYAHAVFEINGLEQRLLILEVVDMGPFRGTLFLAFGDETSARETYAAGRYLNVEKPKGRKSMELDFNLAYNPYCAYNDSYSCPLPPAENLLPVPIIAGEKNYK